MSQPPQPTNPPQGCCRVGAENQVKAQGSGYGWEEKEGRWLDRKSLAMGFC
jgi:hypothetical protein